MQYYVSSTIVHGMQYYVSSTIVHGMQHYICIQYDGAWYAVLCIQLRHASRVDKADAWGRGAVTPTPTLY